MKQGERKSSRGYNKLIISNEKSDSEDMMSFSLYGVEMFSRCFSFTKGEMLLEYTEMSFHSDLFEAEKYFMMEKRVCLLNVF